MSSKTQGGVALSLIPHSPSPNTVYLARSCPRSTHICQKPIDFKRNFGKHQIYWNVRENIARLIYIILLLVMKEKIYNLLNRLNIKFIIHKHEPLYICEQANKYFRHIKSWKSKNLFVRNKKWDKHFLIIIEDCKRLDLKEIWNTLWVWKLSFASEDRLLKYLWITTWAVWPFALINNKFENIPLIIDENLLKSNKLYFHPNDNSETLEISNNDFIQYLKSNNIDYNKIKV